MTYHCVKQCENYKITCDKCGEYNAYPNKNGAQNKIEEHDCFKVLMEKLFEERQKVIMLQAENELLKKGEVRGA